MRLIQTTYCEHQHCARLATGYECTTGRYFCATHETAIVAQAEATGNRLVQLLAVSALIGDCEAIAGSGALTEPAEQSLRILIAQVLSAFHMPAKADLEREVA